MYFRRTTVRVPYLLPLNTGVNNGFFCGALECRYKISLNPLGSTARTFEDLPKHGAFRNFFTADMYTPDKLFLFIVILAYHCVVSVYRRCATVNVFLILILRVTVLNGMWKIRHWESRMLLWWHMVFKFICYMGEGGFEKPNLRYIYIYRERED